MLTVTLPRSIPGNKALLIEQCVVDIGQRVDGDNFNLTRCADGAEDTDRTGAYIENPRHGLAICETMKVRAEYILTRDTAAQISTVFRVRPRAIYDVLPKSHLARQRRIPAFVRRQLAQAPGSDVIAKALE